MESDYLGYLSFMAIGVIILFCLLRFTSRKCREHHSDEFYTTHYFANNETVNHFLVSGDNGFSRVVITRMNNPQHLMEYVLDAGLLPSSSNALPTYEDALKPNSSPPQYEESVTETGSHRSLPGSTATTARVDSNCHSPPTQEVQEESVQSVPLRRRMSMSLAANGEPLRRPYLTRRATHI